MEGTMATIMLFAADFAPKYWARCNGQLLSIAQNSALFSLLGTTFGGDGVTTFGLPNFQSRTPVGVGNGAGLASTELGEMSGTNTVTLLSINLPAHTHTANTSLAVTTAAPNTDENNGAILAAGSLYSSSSNSVLGGVSPKQAGIAGNNAPVSIVQPYLGLNFVICTAGVYPSRP